MTTAVTTVGTSLRDRIAAKKKDIKAKSGLRADVLKVPMGKSKFRILPAHPDLGAEADFWVDFGQHYIKDVEGKTKAVYVCTDKTFGRPCGVCHALEVAGRSASSDDEIKYIEESRCKRAEIIVNVLHLNSSDKANVPQLLQLTPSTFAKVLDLVDEYGDISSLTEGTDLIITREGSGLNTEYSIQPARESKKVDPNVMASVTNLREFVQQESEDGARKALQQVNAIVGIIDAPMVGLPGAKSKALTADAGFISARTVPAEKPVASIDPELDALIDDAVFESMPVARTGTDDVPFEVDAKASATDAGLDELDALLGELEGV
jgi:hypothetical protein